MNEIGEALREYAAIIFGLLLGAIAHFGARLNRGEDLPWKHVLGFAMQLGLIGLFASVVTRVAGITDDDMRALVTAIFAVSANEVIQWMKREGWLRFLPDAVQPAPEPRRKGKTDAAD